MNYNLCEIDVKKNWPVAEALEWILANKPTNEQSKELADQIFANIKITGSADFKEKVIKLINKSSKMATGAEYFRRFLSILSTLEIESGTESIYCDQTKKIYLSSKIGYQTTLNNEFETILVKSSKTTTFLHELNHYIHENSQQFNEIYQKAVQTIKNMDTKYEEGTITGFLHLKKTPLDKTIDQIIYDYCCENTALLELNRPIRVSHSGAFVMEKGDSFIINAISYGHRDYLKRLLSLDTTPKETKLEIAATLGLLEKVQQFIEEGDLIPTQQSLVYALMYKAPITIIYELINAGVEITDLVLANAIKHHLEAAFLLLKEQNATPGISTLTLALQCGHTDIAEQLVKAGIKPTIEMFDSLVFCLKGFEFLLQSGLQPSEKIVVLIIEKNWTEGLSLIVKHGIKITDEMIPLIPSISIAEIFVDQGFIISETQSLNLNYAVYQSSIKLIKHFIEFGAKPNGMHLCLTDNTEILNILIQAGAQLD